MEKETANEAKKEMGKGKEIKQQKKKARKQLSRNKQQRAGRTDGYIIDLKGEPR
ncbi:unnamed protein product [Dovyalis caffra]|uniref:Uncharacterized protein n=1 Tax=Dovyalis caffra TaxID=77055 RepID=A0AAV1STY7_9ROSI|nr:unnamed protein product [Dovyalis caffra]